MNSVAVSPTGAFPKSLFFFLSDDELPPCFRDIRPRGRRARPATAPIARPPRIAGPRSPAPRPEPSVRAEDDLERWDGLS